MASSTDRERQLLNHYRIATLHPEKWPHQDNESSDSDDNENHGYGNTPTRQPSKLSINSRSSYSKYRNIDRHASIRSGTTDSESLVQKDEPDALGMAPSVATQLKRRGVPVDQSDKVRNRFMLSSTTFNPASFLATVHQDATLDDLLRGLDHLSQSIEQKSASLKVLVESNFEKFVKAKATIDNVYIEMRTQGEEPESPSQQEPGRRSHARTLSKNQSHFRTSSGRLSSGQTKKIVYNDKKKNALTKESEYGVSGIKAPLIEVTVKAEEVWGPALGSGGAKEKEETLKSVVSAFEKHEDILSLSGRLNESVRKNDYENIVEANKSAKKYADAARNLADIAKTKGKGELSDADAQLIIVTAKMWHDVSAQIEAFKYDVARRLRDSHERSSRSTSAGGPGAVTDEGDKEEHMHLIAALIQLDVEERAIFEWLNGKAVYLKDKIARSFERARIEIEILRRRLAGNAPAGKADGEVLAKYLRAPGNAEAARGGSMTNGKASDVGKDIDAPAIIAFWEKVLSSITALLSSEHGVLGEVIEYWDTLQSFIDNKAQRSFPTSITSSSSSNSSEAIELTPTEVQTLRTGALELCTLIRDTIFSFFNESPVEDLSDLYSPIPPPTPKTPAEAGMALTPTAKRAFTFDLNAAPPPSPKRGDSWEKFAFWPPQANALSGSLYLSRILIVVGAAASDIAGLGVVKQARAEDGLKSLVSAVRERCVQAVCAAWDADAERVRVLETWNRLGERRDVTTFPARLGALEERLIQNTAKVAYVSDVSGGGGVGGGSAAAEVILPPPKKLVDAVKGTFVTSLYKVLSGMVENAEKGRRNGKEGDADPDGVTVAKAVSVDGDGRGLREVVESRNTRILLTLSNLTHLRTEVLPQLIAKFESSFSVALTEEQKTLRDVGAQIDARLFQSYVQPAVEEVKSSISAGIASPKWEPTTSRPEDARPYVYDVLLKLVLVHSEVTAIASSALTNQILSYLLEVASQALITAFKARTDVATGGSTAKRYTLPALMQATLDVEFMAQTLNNYTTDKAGEVQSQIYLALDERTDNEARARLQDELPGMRAVLKRLRESTRGEFGCFKRERRGRTVREGGGEGRPGSAAGGGGRKGSA